MQSSIFGPEFQNLANPHARAGHEFKHEAVSGIYGLEDDFIDDILFQDVELGLLAWPEKPSQGWVVTGVLEARINRISFRFLIVLTLAGHFGYR